MDKIKMKRDYKMKNLNKRHEVYATLFKVYIMLIEKTTF